MFEFSFVFLVHMSLNIYSKIHMNPIWKELVCYHKTSSQ